MPQCSKTTPERRRTGRLASIIAGGALLGAVSGTVPAAAETIRLTMLSGYTPSATWVGSFLEAFVPAVDAALAKDGAHTIAWNFAHSGQVVKPRGELEGVELGLGDVAIVPTVFHADKVPLYEVPFRTPFTTKDVGLVVATTNKMRARFPQFAEAWRKFGQVSIGTGGAVDNYLLISAPAIAALDDVQGKKIGGSGTNLNWVTALGAAGVQTNVADAYNSLSTGIYEGLIVWAQAMGAFKLCEPAPHVLDAGFGAMNGVTLNINRDVWDALPAPVRAAFRQGAVVWERDQIARVLAGARAGLDRCRDDFGTRVTTLPESDRSRWAKSLPNIAREWAGSLDAKGQPGTEILRAWMDEMRAADQPIARQWDRE